MDLIASIFPQHPLQTTYLWEPFMYILLWGGVASDFYVDDNSYIINSPDHLYSTYG